VHATPGFDAAQMFHGWGNTGRDGVSILFYTAFMLMTDKDNR
jgi:hypothetical protein